MSQTQSKVSRRTLFVGAGTVGGAAAVTGLLPAARQVAIAPSAPRPVPEKGGGYSLSEHVRRYYKTTLV